MAKKKVMVMFGGISPEHEVSIITGVQLIKHASTAKYDVIPVYIDKNGQWWTGADLTNMAYYKSQNLRKPRGLTPFSLNLNKGSNDIDAAILCFHGQYGEAGSIQGALELAGIPHQGPAVTSAAVCFDKIMLRQLLTAEGIGQTKYTWFTKHQWQSNKTACISQTKDLSYPLFVKPANGGSTIGIQKAADQKAFEQAVEVVLHYDDRILVEQAVTNCIEVNVSVLGYEGKTQASVVEQPLNKDEFLSFADKYERGGGKKSGMASATRRIPAPISNSLTQKLQTLAQQLFVLFDCSGVIRIDFFADPSTEEIFVIEPNTIPGSMSYYLWEATGLPYEKLIDQLVDIAEQTFKQNKQLTTSFDSEILNKAAL